MLRKGLVGLMIGAIGVQTAACPTALNVIPIADVLGHREVAFNYWAIGNERNVSRSYEHGAGIQVGLFDRLEFGADSDLMGSHVWNAKLLLFESEQYKYAISVGVQNCSGGYMEPYVVGRYDGKGYRLHVGLLHDSTDRLLAGIDFPLFGEWTGMVDYIGDEGGATWVGVSAPLDIVPGLSLTFSVGFPNTAGEGIQHAATLTYGFRF